MKHSNPLAGMHAAAGDPVMHLSFLITMLLLERNDVFECQLHRYRVTWYLLILAHSLNIPVTLMEFFKIFCFPSARTEIIEPIIDFVALMSYFYAIFYCNELLIFSNRLDPEEEKCLEDEGLSVDGIRGWVSLETTYFLICFASAIIFMFLSKIFGLKGYTLL